MKGPTREGNRERERLTDRFLLLAAASSAECSSRVNSVSKGAASLCLKVAKLLEVCFHNLIQKAFG